MSSTYILFPDCKNHRGESIDIVTEQWLEDGRWVVGERSKKTGQTVFNCRTYGTLAEVCHQKGLDVKEVRKRTIKEDKMAFGEAVTRAAEYGDIDESLTRLQKLTGNQAVLANAGRFKKYHTHEWTNAPRETRELLLSAHLISVMTPEPTQISMEELMENAPYSFVSTWSRDTDEIIGERDRELGVFYGDEDGSKFFAELVCRFLNHGPAMLAMLSANLSAWDDEEDSVKEEHAKLIKELRALITTLDGKGKAAAQPAPARPSAPALPSEPTRSKPRAR